MLQRYNSRDKLCGFNFVPVVVENRFQLMMGSGLPVALQGRKASEFDRTVKLAAFPPLILGLEVISLIDVVSYLVLSYALAVLLLYGNGVNVLAVESVIVYEVTVLLRGIPEAFG